MLPIELELRLSDERTERLTEARGGKVTVHHIPENEDYEGGFEAVTMMGIL